MKAIFELKERLDKENIDHEFIDRTSPYTEFYQIVLKDENIFGELTYEIKKIY